MGIREDVNLLGRTLGQVLREQEGEDFFNLVEEVRALVRRARGGEGSAQLQALDRRTRHRGRREFAAGLYLVLSAGQSGRGVRAGALALGTKGVRSQSLEKALSDLKALGLSAEQVEALIDG